MVGLALSQLFDFLALRGRCPFDTFVWHFQCTAFLWILELSGHPALRPSPAEVTEQVVKETLQLPYPLRC